jgi:hypothetical protein
MGREIYERALLDPDSLADIEDVEDRTLFEGFQYVPGKVLDSRGLQGSGRSQHQPKPTGNRWTDDADLARRYPRLTKRFP